VLDAARADLARPVHYLQRGTYEHRGRIRLARGDAAGAAEDAHATLELGRGALDPQALVPGLSFAAFALLAAGDLQAADELASELLALPALLRPVPHHSAPWLDLSWVLLDLARADELLAAAQSATPRTRWVESAEALARGDDVGAARLLAEAGSPPAEAYTRLRAAQAGLPGADVERAIAFFRKAGATAYLAEAEALEVPA
jgi:hypothetical protein